MKSSLCLLCVGLVVASAYAGNSSTAPNLRDLMKNVVAVQSQIIWDIGNHAQDDQGNLDPKKMKPTDWSAIVSAGDKVKQAAQTLVVADHVMVAAPGQKLQDEGNAGAFDAKAVQRTIDADPKAFNAFAKLLAATMDEIAAAARAKDAAKVADVSNRLDEICEACHTQFWYPEQKLTR
jgi:cytochrome c556